MSNIYIKTWEELINLPEVDVNYATMILSHKNHTGHFCKYSHGVHGGKNFDTIVTDDGWATVENIFFPCWTFIVTFSEKKKKITLDEFPDDYVAFLAWDKSLERRKLEAQERIKDSFRKAFPKEYRHEEENK